MTWERKSRNWGICVRFFQHTEWQFSISLAQGKRGTHVEQTRFISSSLVKMHWMDFLRCIDHLPAFKGMNDGPLQSLLTLHWYWHSSQLFCLPTCSISVDSLSSINAVCHMRVVESCKVSFWKPLYTKRSFPLLIFLISHKILHAVLFSRNIDFLVYVVTHLSGNTHYFHMLVSHVFFYH